MDDQQSLLERQKAYWYATLLRRAIPLAADVGEALHAVELAMQVQPTPPEDVLLSISPSPDQNGKPFQGPSGRWFKRLPSGRVAPCCSPDGTHDSHRWTWSKEKDADDATDTENLADLVSLLRDILGGPGHSDLDDSECISRALDLLDEYEGLPVDAMFSWNVDNTWVDPRGGKRKKWKNTAGGPARYQVNEPGSRGKSKEEPGAAPVAPTPGKPPEEKPAEGAPASAETPPAAPQTQEQPPEQPQPPQKLQFTDLQRDRSGQYMFNGQLAHGEFWMKHGESERRFCVGAGKKMTCKDMAKMTPPGPGTPQSPPQQPNQAPTPDAVLNRIEAMKHSGTTDPGAVNAMVTMLGQMQLKDIKEVRKQFREKHGAGLESWARKNIIDGLKAYLEEQAQAAAEAPAEPQAPTTTPETPPEAPPAVAEGEKAPEATTAAETVSEAAQEPQTAPDQAALAKAFTDLSGGRENPQVPISKLLEATGWSPEQAKPIIEQLIRDGTLATGNLDSVTNDEEKAIRQAQMTFSDGKTKADLLYVRNPEKLKATLTGKPEGAAQPAAPSPQPAASTAQPAPAAQPAPVAAPAAEAAAAPAEAEKPRFQISKQQRDNLVTQHYERIGKQVAKRMRGHADAEDVANDVVVKMIEALDAGKIDPNRFEQYYSQAIRNASVDHLRKVAKGVQSLDALAGEEGGGFEAPAPGRTADQIAADTELLDRLQEQIGEMKGPMRTVLDGFLEGKTGREIAEEMGVNASTVTRHRKRALAHLRDTLGPDFDEFINDLVPEGQ